MEQKRNFTLRQASTNDHKAIYDLIYTAFLTAEHRDGDEQEFTERLRSRAGYRPELELVAEAEGLLIGHILLTPTEVVQPDGGAVSTLMVAPLCVLEAGRGAGVGAALMREGLRRAGALGYGSAFLCGDPNYYQRLGFRPAKDWHICHQSIPEQYVLGYEITSGALDGVHGEVKLG